MRRGLYVLVWLIMVAATGVAPAAADLLGRLIAGAEKAGTRATGSGARALETAAAHLKSLPAEVKGPALAAHVGAEGHWTFVNKSGERYTAAGPDELKRAVTMLAPDAASDARLTIVLTEDAAFRHGNLLKDLPKTALLRVAVGTESHPLIRRGSGTGERLFAEVRPNVLVELSEPRLFDEAVWQLARPLVRTRVRVLALEPGGPQTLSSLPKLDAGTKRALPDRIDPDKLTAALPALSGQTVVITGRLEGAALHYRLPSGTEQRLVLSDVLAAAAAGDVNVIVLQSQAPRQPGTRNWLWQRVDVDGLEKALERTRLSDFLDALAAGQGKLLIEARDRGASRTTVRAMPINEEGSLLSGWSGLLTDVVSEVAGRVVTSAIEADVTSADRQRELDRRVVPGIPSAIQIGYLVLLLVGMVGIGVALGWWRRIWPPEARDAYGNGIGYGAAWLMRSLLFTFVFVPAVAVVSAPLAVARSAWETLAGIVTILMWPLRLMRRAKGA